MFINKVIVGIVQLLPKNMVYFFAKKYIAGPTLKDAINVVKQLNSKGILATMDVLGEAVTSREEVILAKTECLTALNAIQDNDLKANLSIKPTQIGLLIDEELCYTQVAELVKKAASIGTFVRIDMEDSSCTDKTINLYERLLKTNGNVGIVLQAYLRRTMSDIRQINRLDSNYRLCKGIYIEPAEIAFQEKQEVRDNYLKCLKEMLSDGKYCGIATHDDSLINGALKIIEDLKLSKDKYEFQMLYGVKEQLRDKINSDGHRIRIYVPYGKDWYKYSIRRLKENPNMAGQIFVSLFKVE